VFQWPPVSLSRHITGWGGYTFNSSLFPDPTDWIDYVHSEGNVMGHSLKLSLNLHPQTGVDATQTVYPQVARALGIDPATNITVVCDYDNQTYSDVLFNLVMDVEPLSGVDYWWTDYGGCSSLFDIFQAQFWTNYNFVEHMNMIGEKRPLLLSRYGGLGSQRLPVGFSGDTFQVLSPSLSLSLSLF
jgi:alpha-glucosidase (family GH31 glycosyl hydrolase)